MARATRSGSRVDTAVLAVCVALSLLALVLPDRRRQDLAGAVRETFVGPLIALQTQAERVRGAFVARELSEARLDSLTLRNADLRDMERENVRLRELLGLGARLRTGFVPAMTLHRRELGDAHTVLVTAGSGAGVVERAAVIAPEGLVGTIVTVGSATSTAILWSHPDFRVSAMSADGAAFGIIAPRLAAEPERFLLELRGVAYRDSLAPGTAILSSGMGSVFPRGIPIGTVVDELTTGEGWSRTYLVRPAVMPADVTWVMVLLPLAQGGDLGTVWSVPSSADSALRGVLRAADSLLARTARRDSATGPSDTVRVRR